MNIIEELTAILRKCYDEDYSYEDIAEMIEDLIHRIELQKARES